MAPYKLFQVIESDVPVLARIAHSAFAEDRHTRLRALNPVNPYNHEETMQEALQHWFSLPNGQVHLVKAVDETSGKPVGWVCWGHRGLDTPTRESLKLLQQTSTKRSFDEEVVETSAESKKSALSVSKSVEDPLRPLNDITSHSMQEWMARLMPEGARCMYIISIVVDPIYNNHGVGRMLVNYGTDRADDAGAYCWVHSSEAGERLFESCEFHEVGRLEVDLDEWADKIQRQIGQRPSSGTDSWGQYVFKYMPRDSPASRS